jgi:branched-chain amino acid aminotransferase
MLILIGNNAGLNKVEAAYNTGQTVMPQDIFMQGLKELVSLDKDWIPTKNGSALYIRPFLFAIDEFVGVRPAKKFLFII